MKRYKAAVYKVEDFYHTSTWREYNVLWDWGKCFDDYNEAREWVIEEVNRSVSNVENPHYKSYHIGEVYEYDEELESYNAYIFEIEQEHDDPVPRFH